MTNHEMKGSRVWQAGLPALILCWVAAGGGGAFAQTAGSQDLIERTSAGRINWSAGWIEATGLGMPPEQGGPAKTKAKVMTERAAFVVALRNLLETVNGVRVDAETVVGQMVLSSDVIRTRVSGFVQGARIVKTQGHEDGSVAVTVQAPLRGIRSLLEPVAEPQRVPQASAPTRPDEGGATGLVIDARGLGVKPGLFPKILDEQGEVLFGPAVAEQAEEGLVQYRTLPPEAGSSLWLDEGTVVIRPVRVEQAPREGRRPLTLKGVSRAGTYSVNVLISAKDAERIRRDPGLQAALRRSKVVVVTDSLIEGATGHASEAVRPVQATCTPFPPGTRGYRENKRLSRFLLSPACSPLFLNAG